jgi:hypothetical protein
MLNSKNVIYTGAFRFPNGDAASQRVLNNAKIFRDLGYKVIFISWGGASRYEDMIDGKFIYQGFEYLSTNEISDTKRSILTKIKGLWLRGSKSMKLINNMDNVDIIIGYNTPFIFTKRVLRYCKKKGIKYTSDITEWYSHRDFWGGKFTPLFWMNELNMRFLQKRVKNKIVISSFLNNYYEQSNNIILPPLVDLSEQKWLVDNSFSIEAINTHKGLRIIYAGSPANKDLLGQILEAFFFNPRRRQAVAVYYYRYNPR